MNLQLRGKGGKAHPVPDDTPVEIVKNGLLAGVVLHSRDGIRVLTPGDTEFLTYANAVGMRVADVTVHTPATAKKGG